MKQKPTQCWLMLKKSAKGSGPKTREFKLLMYFILFEMSYLHYEMSIISKAMYNKYAVYK